MIFVCPPPGSTPMPRVDQKSEMSVVLLYLIRRYYPRVRDWVSDRNALRTEAGPDGLVAHKGGAYS